jgi:hypothetical protein
MPIIPHIRNSLLLEIVKGHVSVSCVDCTGPSHTTCTSCFRIGLPVAELGVCKTLFVPLPYFVRGGIVQSVGIATGYGLDDRGVGVPSPVGVKNFNFPTSSRPALGHAQLPIQWVPGGSFPGSKAAGA